MNSKNMLMGIMIGIAMAILWSIVFVNVLNSMAGIGVGYALASLLVYPVVLFCRKR